MTHCPRDYVPFRSFDQEYVEQLTAGVPSVEEHFAEYFGTLISIKLRKRLNSPQAIEDVRQETLLRVIQSLRRKGGLRSAERLGAFVHSVCRNVLFELYRSEAHYASGQRFPDPVDDRVDLDASLVTGDRKRLVETVLAMLPERERELLRMTFLEERDRAEVCRKMGLTEDYYRVVLHRARSRFKEKHTRSLARPRPRKAACANAIPMTA